MPTRTSSDTRKAVVALMGVEDLQEQRISGMVSSLGYRVQITQIETFSDEAYPDGLLVDADCLTSARVSRLKAVLERSDTYFPTIVLGEHDNPVHMQRAVEIGACEYASKPTTSDDLGAILAGALLDSPLTVQLVGVQPELVDRLSAALPDPTVFREARSIGEVLSRHAQDDVDVTVIGDWFRTEDDERIPGRDIARILTQLIHVNPATIIHAVNPTPSSNVVYAQRFGHCSILITMSKRAVAKATTEAAFDARRAKSALIYDPITGAVVGDELVKRLEQAIARIRDGAPPGVFIAARLRDWEAVCSACGAQHSNAIAKKLGAVLKGRLKTGDTLGYANGWFYLVVENAEKSYWEELMLECRRVVRLLQPNEIASMDQAMDLVVGLVELDEASDALETVEQAEEAWRAEGC